MNELVLKSEKGTAITNSLLVGGKFEKEHRNVIRDIEELRKDVLNFEQIFIESSYLDSYNRNQKMYVMNRDGFNLLTMGFTGKKALKFKLEFIAAFNKMEAMLNSDDYILARSQEILRERLEATQQRMKMLEGENSLLLEQKETLEVQAEINAPKVHFAESFKASSSLMLIRDLAKYINQNISPMGGGRFYDWLVQHNYLIRTKRWSNTKQKHEYDYMPTQRASDMKIFHVTPTIINSTEGQYLFTKHTVKVNAKGQSYFINKFLQAKNDAA